MFSTPTATAPVTAFPTELATLVARLSEYDPSTLLDLVRQLGAPSIRASVEAHLADAVAAKRTTDADVDGYVLRAHAAQQHFENWTDERVDDMLLDLANAFAARAQELAEAAVRETGIGNARDKAVKNRFASLGAYDSIGGRIAQGPLESEAGRQVTEIASPVGVVFGVVPLTNPVATAIFKTLVTLKPRNALILTFPQRASGVAEMSGAIIRSVMQTHGAPADLVQWIGCHGSRKLTRAFMSHPKVSLILATGGASLVRAAYSSGTPAIGVGPGNAPAWICADADLDRAARAIVASKAFDNGLVCGAEHNLVVDDRAIVPFVQALERHDAAVLDLADSARMADALFDRGTAAVRRELVGQSAADIADRIGIRRPYPVRLLVVRSSFTSPDDPCSREKRAPILSLFTVNGEDEGLRLCRALLEGFGAGHTAVIHTTNAARVERFGRAMPAGRILVNTPAAQGCCGMTTGLVCSMTLGCGTFGGNSTTDNLTYRHLLNVKRVAYDVNTSAP